MPNPLFEFIKTEVLGDFSTAERELEATLSRLVAAGNQPDFVIPFAIDMTEALNRFHKWLKGLSFVPGTLKTRADLGALTPCYVPFWAIHSLTCTSYSGERGEEVKTTEEYTDASGEVKTREVTKIEWHPAWGEVRQLFDNVYLCAAGDVPETHLAVLEPREVRNHQSFSPEAVAQTTARAVFLDARTAFTRARDTMEKKLRAQVERDIGGKQQRVNRMDTRHVGVSMKLLLVPAYEGTYRYGGKPYKVLINGATGDVSGDYPISAGKVLLAILLVLGVIALIGAAIWFFLIRPHANPRSEQAVERPALVQMHPGFHNVGQAFQPDIEGEVPP